MYALSADHGWLGQPGVILKQRLLITIYIEIGWSLNRFRVRFDGILSNRDEKHLLKVNVFVVSENLLPQLLF